MFVNLFIGDKPAEREKEYLSLSEMRNGKMAIFNKQNNRYLTFQKPIDVAEPEIINGESDYFIDQETNTCLGYVNIGLISGYHSQIQLDYKNLNPKFYKFEPGDSHKDKTQFFVNIDTAIFIPLIFKLPEGAVVKDSYHYGRHFYGFILEVEEDLLSTEAASSLIIYGYDTRLPLTHEMNPYHMIEVSADARYATEEERVSLYPTLRRASSMPEESDSDAELAHYTVSHSHSGMNKKDRKTFFRMRSMYQKTQIPRIVRLNGDLFTNQIIGTIPLKDARERISNAKKMNHVPMDTPYQYWEVPKEGYETEEEWYEKALMPIIKSMDKENIHAITVTDDINIPLRDARSARIQQVLHLHEDGTITSALSNR